MVRTGIKMTHVPFRGAAPLVQEIMAGRIGQRGIKHLHHLRMFFQPCGYLQRALLVTLQARTSPSA